MRLGLAAILRAAVRQDSKHSHALIGKEWQHPVIEQISTSDRCLGGVDPHPFNCVKSAGDREKIIP